MCIICNCDEIGDRFLLAFARSRKSMKESTRAMLECSKAASDHTIKARYSFMHKKMVRLERSWNAIEQEREASEAHLPD